MYQNKLSLKSRKKNLFRLVFFVLLTMLLSACGGGSQAKEVAMSEQVPMRRGNADILLEVQDITAEILGIPFDEVVEDADFRQDLGADEAQMTELGEVFAEAFTIELTDAEIKSLTTVKSAVELIESKQQ